MNSSRHLRLAILLVSTCCLSLPGQAQTTITPTTGGPLATSGNTTLIPASLGTQVGGNLFHSFSQFDVAAGDTAKFTPTGSTMAVNNIIARIYSASPSSINGNILVDPTGNFSASNLFLINPNGVIFGAGASVSVPGNFVVSTANYLNFDDGVGNTGVFYSDPGNALSGNDSLTSAPIASFGFFKGSTPAGITVNGSSLIPGANLQFVGGGFTATGNSTLTASKALSIFSGGPVSAATDATVPYVNGSVTDYSAAAHFTSYGNVTLGDSSHGATLSTTDSTGSVVIRGGRLVQTGGTIHAPKSVSIQAASLATTGGTISTQTGKVAVDTTGDVTLTGGTITSVSGPIALGQVSLVNLTLDLNSSITETDSTGAALTINSTGVITNHGTISTAGTEAPVQVSAQSLSLSGTISTQASLLQVDATNDMTLTGGAITSQAGTVQIGSAKLRNLSLDSTSSISSASGPVTVTARGDLTVHGGSITSTATTGTAGNVTVNAQQGTITLDTGAQIASIASGSANAGTVFINGRNITLTGTGVAAANTGIFSMSNGTGNSGNVSINASGNIVLSAGGQIASLVTDATGGSAGGVALILIGNPSALTVGGISPNATTPVPIIYTSTANPNQNDGEVEVLSFFTNIELQPGAAIQTSTQDALADAVFVLGKSVTLDTNSAIQSVMNQTNRSDNAKTGQTGAVEVVALDTSVFPYGGQLSIADGAYIQTVANPNLSGFNPIGQVYVFAGSLIEGGVSVPTSDNIGDYAYKIHGHTNIRMYNATTFGGANGTDQSAISKPIVATLISFPLNIGNDPTTIPTPPPGNGLVLDGSLGGISGPITPVLQNGNYLYTVTSADGLVAGSNLFLSFSQFDLGIDHPDSSNPSKIGPVSETALFNAPSIANILLRVTGGGVSEINGTLLEAPGTNANLFLLNSGGLLIATNASLNLNGALTLSTANTVGISGGGFFTTQINSIADHQITANASLYTGAVNSFGFTTATPAAINFDTATLSNDSSANNEIQLIGGNITLGDDSLLNASQTLLFSAGGPGLLTFTLPGGSLAAFPGSFLSSSQILNDSSFTALGTVTLSGGSVLTVPSPNIASTILIRAANFNLTDSLIVDQTTADVGSLGGQVLIDATNAVTITGSTSPAFISTSTLGASDGGSIEINAATLTITGAQNGLFPAGILSTAQPGNFYTSDEGYVPYVYNTPSTATGKAGSITLAIGGQLTVSTFGQISTDTNGLGNAGTITIRGLNNTLPQVTVSGGSGITSSTSLSNPSFTTTGNAGRVNISASSLTLTGNLTLIASSAGIPLATSGPTGDGGNVSLTVTGAMGQGNGDITISNGAQVSASSYNNGQGGVVIVNQSNATNGILIDGMGSASATGLFAAEFGDGSSSALGMSAFAINVTTSSPLTLRAGGQITTSAGGNGSAGPIRVASGNISIDGTGTNAAQSTGIFSSSTGQGVSTTNLSATGNGGDITIEVTGDLKVSQNGSIAAASQTAGEAGVIAIVQSGSTTIVDPSTNPATNGGIYISSGGEISTAALGIGTPSQSNSIAGNITLNAQALTLDNGQITSSTSGLSKAGDVVLGAFNGGAPPQFVVVQDGGVIASNTGGAGNGGMIALTAGSLAVVGTSSTISTGAVAGTGGGGSIQVTVVGNASVPGAIGDIVIANGGAISASSLTTGEAGTVTITQSGSQDITDPTLNPATNGGIFLNNGLITTAANGTGTASPSNPNAGNITLNTEALMTTGGSLILSSTAGLSKAGDVTVGGSTTGQAAQVVMMQNGAKIASETGGVNGRGAGGTITMRTDSLVNDDSIISTSATGGLGNAGDISIAAVLDGPSAPVPFVTLKNGGTITSESNSVGSAGMISILANQILVTGLGSAISTNAGSIGNAANSRGEIMLTASDLTLSKNGLVSATTGGFSPGGTLTVTATDKVILVSSAKMDASSTASTGGGNGGSILIGSNPATAIEDYGVNSPELLSLADNSVISADSQHTNGGNIAIHADQVIADGHTLISTNEPNGAANTVGGNITIRAGHIFYLNNISFVNSNAGQGTGGNIKIDPQFVVLNQSGINAIGGLSNGNVEIDSDFLLSSLSSITATGIVQLSSPPLDLSGSLIALPADLTDNEKRLRESCVRSVNHEFSSLVVVGRGGIETSPTELSPDIDTP